MNEGFSNGNATSKIPEHPDYSRNLNWGGKFCKNYNDKMNRLMTLRVMKNTDGEKYYFEFSFIPNEDKYTNYATSLDPNQESEKFMTGFKNTYYEYHKMQRKWDDKHKYHQEFIKFDPK